VLEVCGGNADEENASVEMAHARRLEEGVEGLPIDLFLQCPEDACPWIDDGRAGWDKRHTLPSTDARRPIGWQVVEKKKQQRASLTGDAVGAGAGPAGQLLWLLYRDRAATGNLFAGDSSIQGWGVTPENSVVNGADTSTDGSIE
jgi:hypothetical protein